MKRKRNIYTCFASGKWRASWEPLDIGVHCGVGDTEQEAITDLVLTASQPGVWA